MPQKNSQPSIQTTETHRRTHKITLDTHQIRSILIDEALRMAGLERTAGVYSDIFIHPAELCPATRETRPTATVTITVDLPTPTDFAPPNIEEIVRLNPPATPGLSQRQIDDALVLGKSLLGTNANLRALDDDLSMVMVQAKSRTLKEPTSFETPGLNTTATSSRENIEAIERMKRITRLHEVLLHSKGNNIVLNRDEVDTLLEMLEYSAVG